MIKALILPMAGMLLTLCLAALAYAYFGAVSKTARCTCNPNTCKNDYCSWPSCNEETL